MAKRGKKPKQDQQQEACSSSNSSVSSCGDKAVSASPPSTSSPSISSLSPSPSASTLSSPHPPTLLPTPAPAPTPTPTKKQPQKSDKSPVPKTITPSSSSQKLNSTSASASAPDSTLTSTSATARVTTSSEVATPSHESTGAMIDQPNSSKKVRGKSHVKVKQVEASVEPEIAPEVPLDEKECDTTEEITTQVLPLLDNALSTSGNNYQITLQETEKMWKIMDDDETQKESISKETMASPQRRPCNRSQSRDIPDATFLKSKQSYAAMAEQAVENVIHRLISLCLELFAFDVTLIGDQIIHAVNNKRSFPLKFIIAPLVTILLRKLVWMIVFISNALGQCTWRLMKLYLWVFFLPVRFVEFMFELNIRFASYFVDIFATNKDIQDLRSELRM